MQPPGAVIDLDRLVPDEPPPAPPSRTRRRGLAAALLAVVLLTLNAAAAPAAPPLVPVRTSSAVNAAAYRIFGDTLYVTESRPAGNRVTAYPLPAGPPRWSTRIPLEPANSQLGMIGDVVVVSMFVATGPGDRTVALDRATGAVRWRSPHSVVALDELRGRVLLAEYPPPGSQGGGPGAEVTALRAADGTEVWRYHHDGTCESQVPPRVTRPERVLAVLCLDGTLESVDLDSGRTKASIALSETVGIAGVGFGATLAGLDDRILLSVPGPFRAVLTAYDPERLSVQWRLQLDPMRYSMIGCGPRICVFSSGTVQGVDPASGAVAWQKSPIGGGTPYGDRYVLVAPPRLGEEWLLDARTGDTLLTLDKWSAIPSGEPMFLRVDPAGHQTWAAGLSAGRPVGSVPAPVALRFLGPVPAADPDTCQATDRYLVCRTVKDTVQVWRLDAPG